MTWQDNADKFALLDKGEGWPFAVLVACSVRRDIKGGPRTVSIETVKTSAREFAERAHTSAARVLRYLDAWDKAADKGLFPPAEELTPADADTMPCPDIPWGDVYEAAPKPAGKRRESDPIAAMGTVEDKFRGVQMATQKKLDRLPPDASAKLRAKRIDGDQRLIDNVTADRDSHIEALKAQRED